VSIFSLAALWDGKAAPEPVAALVSALAPRLQPASIEAVFVCRGERETNVEIRFTCTYYPREQVDAFTMAVEKTGGRLVELWRLPKDARDAFRARHLRGPGAEDPVTPEAAATLARAHLEPLVLAGATRTLTPVGGLPAVGDGAQPLARLKLERKAAAAEPARSGPEQRRARRFDVDLEIAYETDLEFVREHAINISQGGLFVRTDEPPELDSVVKVEVKLPNGERLLGQAVVAHVAFGSDGPGVGLTFLTEDPSFMASLDRYLARLAAEAPPMQRAVSGALDAGVVPKVSPVAPVAAASSDGKNLA
jgi:uncharacterized protein (TIGR02266 family)